jgi:hypothetical protein
MTQYNSPSLYLPERAKKNHEILMEIVLRSKFVLRISSFRNKCCLLDHSVRCFEILPCKMSGLISFNIHDYFVLRQRCYICIYTYIYAFYVTQHCNEPVKELD